MLGDTKHSRRLYWVGVNKIRVFLICKQPIYMDFNHRNIMKP